MIKISTHMFILAAVVIFVHPLFAEDKYWDAGGDGVMWSDDDNWYSSGEPVSGDDVTIDAQDASVLADETFNARSVIIGGKEESVLTIEKFVYGTIAPDDAAENAVLNQAGGKIILKGSAGIVTVKGQYMDSEASLTNEPSFMFWIK